MPNAFDSYRHRKQLKINAKMASMRDAKERKRIEGHIHEPVRQDIDDSLEIIVVRRTGGKLIHEDRYLLVNEECRGTINQYDVWDAINQSYIGLMGIYKAFIHASAKCPRVRRSD